MVVVPAPGRRAVRDRRQPMGVLRRRALGLGQFTVIVLVVLACVAGYQRVLKPVDEVLLQAGTVGNQVAPRSDVKVRGVIVGEVAGIDSDGRRATLHLAIDPDAISAIPSDTRARFVPTSLFGEKFVDLAAPPQDRSRPLRAGDVITADRTERALETEELLDTLLPVLTAVRPQELSDTLGAVSTALSGRGRELGETLVLLNRYLAGADDALPALRADLERLPAVADTTGQAAPDLLAALDDLAATGRTVVEQRARFTETFRSVTGAADAAGDTVSRNREDLITVTAVARPVADLLARYSPELPCLLRQGAAVIPRIDDAISPGHGLHLVVELVRDRGPYGASEAPRYADHRGPRCYSSTPNDPQDPPEGPLRDGATHPAAPPPDLPFVLSRYPNLSALLTGGAVPAPRPTTVPQSVPGRVDPARLGATDTVGSPEERSLVTELTALQMHRRDTDVPPFAPYLTAASMRGLPIVVG